MTTWGFIPPIDAFRLWSHDERPLCGRGGWKYTSVETPRDSQPVPLCVGSPGSVLLNPINLAYIYMEEYDATWRGEFVFIPDERLLVPRYLIEAQLATMRAKAMRDQAKAERKEYEELEKEYEERKALVTDLLEEWKR